MEDKKDQKETTPVVVIETAKETTPEPAATTATPPAATEEHHVEKLFIRGLSYSTRELTLARFVESVAPVFVFLFPHLPLYVCVFLHI